MAQIIPVLDKLKGHLEHLTDGLITFEDYLMYVQETVLEYLRSNPDIH